MRRVVFLIPDSAKQPRGGIMNLVRHGRVARAQGAEAVLATESGRDGHGRSWFRHDLPCIPWDERRPGDACVVPDLYSDRAAAVAGPCIVYLQTPLRLERNFDHLRPGVRLWTDSPFMLERCRAVFPGTEIAMVPNVVDEEAFPFIPQGRRRDGMIIFFPRKGEDFGRAVFDAYRRGGGRYWKPRTVDRMRFDRMSRLFRKPQAFFASAEVEGCALPPQESMAAGIVVVGRDARGANFCMEHGETAMVANGVEEAVGCLRALEDPALRQRLAERAYEQISRFFPRNEPAAFWRGVLEAMGDGR
jgi:glycosyltransferase involved in cell wall biosynthesis